MSAEHDKSLPEKIIYRGGEYLGLIGGVWYLLNGNVPAAIVGVAVAIVSSLLGRRQS